jgi:hypothetical protein
VSAGTYAAGPFHETVVLTGGTYVFCTAWNTNAQANVTSDPLGPGVTIYVLGGGKINGGSSITLAAPTTGPYAGIAMWYGDSNQVTWNGGNATSFSGAIYAPKANVKYAGNASSAASCTRLVAGSITFIGTSTSNFDNSTCPTVSGAVLTASGVSGSATFTGAPMLVQ